MSDEAIYREFIDWFKMSWHLPETEELMPLIKARFSPEEAAFFTNMPLGLTRLEDIAETWPSRYTLGFHNKGRIEKPEISHRLDELFEFYAEDLAAWQTPTNLNCDET